jgi:RND family efflux transporter MFP subunit
MKSLRSIAPLAIFMLTVFAGLNACSKQAGIPTAPTVERGVHVVSIKNQQLPDQVSAVGSVHSVESAAIASQVMGNVLRVFVNEGDHVRAGATLLSIDAASLRSDLERAHAAVVAAGGQAAAAESETRMAAATLKRYEDLKEKKSVSPQEFEEVETRFHVASAHLEMVRSQINEARAQEASANTMLGYTHLRAPFDGVVTERKVDPGALATPGTPLLTIEKAGRLRLEVSVDESLLSTIRPGASIPVMIDAIGGAALTGKVAEIVPVADPGSHSFLVKIDLPAAPGLRSGMFGRAQLSRGSKTALVVPRSAVVTHGSLQGVYVVDANQIANLRYITLGNTQGEQVDVLSGLTAGELVIDAPDDRDLAGKRIEAQP